MRRALALIAAAALLPAFSVAGLQPKWETYKFPEGNFSISLPAKPEQSSRPLRARGDSMDIHSYVVATKQDTYLVSYTDYEKFDNAEKIGDILEGAKNGAVNNAKGTLLEERGITIAGHPGKAIKFSLPAGQIARENILLVRNRLYQILVISTKERINASEANRFLSSFRLISN